jgi:copper chaperone CopZ
MTEFNYKIDGMHCANCVTKIKSTLSSKYNLVEISLIPPLLKIEASTSPSLEELNHDISKIGHYHVYPITEGENGKETTFIHQTDKGLIAYYPLFLIATYLVGVTFINNYHQHSINWQSWMNQFMAGFFLVFSAFKFLDVKGFAEGYSTYDLLAKHWSFYGFIYPFIELGLGILYLSYWYPTVTQLLTIIIMGFSSLGVIASLVKKQRIHCACLGTIINVPLSSITLIEDLLMVALATASLIMR